jgi:hypothetical protein
LTRKLSNTAPKGTSSRIQLYLDETMYQELLKDSENACLSIGDFLKYLYCSFRMQKEAKTEKTEQKTIKQLQDHEKLRQEILRLKEHDEIQTPSLRIAETLVKEYGFKVSEVREGNQQTRTPKLWFLFSPYAVPKSQHEKQTEKKNLFEIEEDSLELQEDFKL